MFSYSRFTFCLLLMVACVTGSVFAAGVPSLPSVTWSQVSTATAPSPRMAGAMAYDPFNGVVVLFGGLDKSAYLNDTWIFDGSNWTQVSTPVAPPIRVAANMAYDRNAHQLVMFGGYDGHTHLGDTWIWDSATMTWSEPTTTHHPKGVTGPSLFTDPLNGRVDMFGGFDGFLYQLITWRWTGSDWRMLHPAASPSARSAAIASTNSGSGSAVLFDGLGDVNPYNTWTFDGANWTQQFPGVQPQSLYDAGSAYDANIGGVVLFGGGHAGIDQNETWVWTGTNWLQLVPAASPAARESFGMAYDSSLGRTVIFGGFTGAGYLNDTWILTRP